MKIQALTCCHSQHYKNLNEFKLIPGHRDLMIGLSKLDYPTPKNRKEDFSFLMNALINQASQIDKKCSQYDEIIRSFATYVFLMCGRSCYSVSM